MTTTVDHFLECLENYAKNYSMLQHGSIATQSYKNLRYQYLTLIIFLLLLLDFCSHRRSNEIYAESKYEPNVFIAAQCSLYIDYKQSKCKDKMQTGVGYNAMNV